MFTPVVIIIINKYYSSLSIERKAVSKLMMVAVAWNSCLDYLRCIV